MEGSQRRSILLEHLRACAAVSRLPRSDMTNPRRLIHAIPAELEWARSSDIARSINGYELAPHLGLGDVGDFANSVAEQVRMGRPLPASLEELWLCLFFEHRRWHHFGYEPEGEDRRFLERLCRALAREAAKA